MSVFSRFKKTFNSIRVQVSLIHIAISLLSVLIFSGVIYYSVSNIFVNEAVVEKKTSIDQSAKYISLYIDKIKEFSSLIAKNQFLCDLLCDDVNNSYLETIVKNEIDTIIENDPNIKSIVIVSKNGRIISNEKNLDMATSENMMNQAWYKNAIKNDVPVLTSARMQEFSMDNKNWVLSLSREIVDPKGENIGVLLIDIKYFFMEDYLKNLSEKGKNESFILGSDGEVVYHKELSYFTDSQKKKVLLEVFNSDKKYESKSNRLTYQTKISGTDWTLVSVSELDSLKMLKRQLFEMVAITAILILAGVWVIGYFFANRITKPIHGLAKRMNEVEQFVPFEVENNASEEIEILGDSYNKMLVKIQDLMNQLSAREKHMKEFEINALIGQINPHFLYNTLDTIVWMAEFEENDKVIEITKSLASFFRLSLNKGQTSIPLAQEIMHVKEYLAIQKQRYTSKLNYSFHIEEDIMDCIVPKIILQPIVENSIYHGINELDGRGEIEIKGRRENDKIILEVIDNGVGFHKDTIGRGSSTKLSGIGMSNVDQRIKLFYQSSKDVGLTVKSEIGKGTCVRLTLECKTKEEG